MNFTCPFMKPKIFCSCLQSDGFEVENLINSKAKGFQAERFSKAPIFVTIQFAIPIQLKCIFIAPFLGQQCARVVQIYILHSGKFSEDHDIRAEDVTYRAGSFELSQTTTIRFRNKYYKCDRDLKDSPDLRSCCIEKDLQGRLYNVTAVKIGILSMLRGTVPSISQLEVWGAPSTYCKKSTSFEWVRRWNEHKQKVSSSTKEPNIVKQDIGPGAPINVTQPIGPFPQHFTPKEFTDPITLILMKCPVLLPGGQTIDQSTLNKHLSTQSEWGRPPSDPFTGVPFTEKYKPIPNLSLKLKIDKYLMSESPPPTRDGCSQKLQSQVGAEELQSISSKKRKLTYDKNPETLNEKGTGSSTAENTLVVAHGAPKYRLLQIKEPAINPLHCSSCSTYFSSLSSHYSLPCQHRLCRGCLLSATLSSSCPTCHGTFRREQIRRTHS